MRQNIWAAHTHQAPVWIVTWLEGGRPTRMSVSSTYPAVQNMLLAARALGVGATLTMLCLQFKKEAEAALGLTHRVHSYALLPIDYPMGRCAPLRRNPAGRCCGRRSMGSAPRSEEHTS